VRRAVVLFGAALIVYAVAVAAIFREPGVTLASPEPLGLLLGVGISVVVLLLLPVWW
jgi:hypothetical protein